MIDVAALRPYPGNARRHSRKQIKQIAKSIETFGFTNPVLIGEDLGILAGHGRVAAAQLIGMKEVPIVRLSDLSPAERKAYVLADNKLALNAGWDREVLAIELQGLIDLGFDLETTGFTVGEIEVVVGEAAEGVRQDASVGSEDNIPPVRESRRCRAPAISGRAGRHRLICGDARERMAYETLLGNERVDLIFTDAPHNVPIGGNVCGSGQVRHREFAMGVGEMTSAEFTIFLERALSSAAERCRDGAIAFVCMDWRYAGELLAAGKTVFTELKDLCVWNKASAGTGTFYRSKHELILVFKKGTAPHVDSFGRGETGRPRSNVWDYPGVSSIGPTRTGLAMHPTVKPTRLVADAIKDCSRRGDLVLDPFAGFGTTLIAAQKTGRSARLIEYDPAYCDTILRRFARVTGKQATLAATGETFEVVERKRESVAPSEGSAE